MKKILAVVAILAVLCFAGYNKQIIDTTYKYSYAIIGLPNGEVVEGKVQSWGDYDNSDQLQVQIDGVMYLVHSSQVVLMSKEK